MTDPTEDPHGQLIPPPPGPRRSRGGRHRRPESARDFANRFAEGLLEDVRWRLGTLIVGLPSMVAFGAGLFVGDDIFRWLTRELPSWVSPWF